MGRSFSPGYIHCADAVNHAEEAFASSPDDGGWTFGPAPALAASGAMHSSPSLTPNRGNVHAGWLDAGGGAYRVSAPT
jgi:hypothetical protein